MEQSSLKSQSRGCGAKTPMLNDILTTSNYDVEMKELVPGFYKYVQGVYHVMYSVHACNSHYILHHL